MLDLDEVGAISFYAISNNYIGVSACKEIGLSDQDNDVIYKIRLGTFDMP